MTTSPVRYKLMHEEGFTPFCGSEHPHKLIRTQFNGAQFQCPYCEWKSNYFNAFIQMYKRKWGIK